jgi:hypothetical protein
VKANHGPFRGAWAVNGIAIQTPNVGANNAYRWEYKGDLKPDGKGLITISFVRDSQIFPVVSYVILRKKK